MNFKTLFKTASSHIASEGIDTVKASITTTINGIILKFAIIAITISLILTGGCVATSYIAN